MSKALSRLLACALTLWACCGNIVAQQTSATPESPQQLPVYIVDFKKEMQPELVGEFGDLSAFTSGIIQLRLLEIPSVTVHRVPTPPICERSQSKANQTGQALRAEVVPSGDFYTVEGLIETQLPNVVLSYWVVKCEGQKLKKVFQDTQPFTLDHALDQITIVAHAIAFKIEKAVPPTRVGVALFETDNDLQDQKDIAAALHKAILQELSKSPDYEVTTPSDCEVRGHITFQKNRQQRFLSNGGDVVAQMRVEVNGKPYPLNTVLGSRDQLSRFYAEVSSEVLRGLPQVLLAEHLQLPGIIEKMKTDALSSRAGQLLNQCPAEGECANAQDAVTLLSAAVQQEPTSWTLSFMLGKAQMRAGRSRDAVASLQKAEDMVRRVISQGNHIPVAEQVQLLNQLGDGYRNINEYDRAQTTYDVSLLLDRSQATVYRSRAQVFQYQNKPLLALRSLIDGLKISAQDSEAESLHNSAKNIVLTLQGNEMSRALTLLRDSLSDAPVSNEYALLIAYKWAQILHTDWTQENQANAREELKNALDLHPEDPQALAMVYLMSAEVELHGNRQLLHEWVDRIGQLPASKVPAETREWAERVLGQDYIDHSEYDKARQAADEAYHVLPTYEGSNMIAYSTLLIARCKEKAWKNGKEPSSMGDLCKEDTLLEEKLEGNAELTSAQRAELQNLYQEAASHAASLVGNGFQPAYSVLMRADHSLGKDSQTRDEFLGLIRKDPKNQAALDVVMFVCSQYLFDFPCAYLAAQKSASTLPQNGPTAANDWMNLAELPVLQGDGKTALEWLDVALRQPDVSDRTKSLIYLYRLWVEMRQGQTGEFKRDFDSWHEAAARFRDGNDDISWIFTGARKALDDQRSVLGDSRTKLLISMMNALDDRTSPLPSWPDSGTL